MNDKDRAVMQQALEALEHKRSCAYKRIDQNPSECTCGVTEAITALQEALAHSGEATEMVGCAYCNNPLFAGTKCNNCGRITLAEQAKLTEDTISHRKLAEQAEQKPLPLGTATQVLDEYFLAMSDLDSDTLIYAAPVRTKDLTDEELAGACGCKLGDPMYEWVVDIGRSAIAADREKNK